jgi:hypothetical protein
VRVGLVQLDVPAESGDQRTRVEMSPPDAGLEGDVGRQQPAPVRPQFVVRRPAAGDETVQVIGPRRARAHRRSTSAESRKKIDHDHPPNCFRGDDGNAAQPLSFDLDKCTGN